MKAWFALILLTLLAGCASARRDDAMDLVRQAGWHWQLVPGGRFTLAAAAAPKHAATLTVFLEGDGFAYVDARTPSDDPTPRDPVALKMALAHPGPAAWLARPCQYTMPAAGCEASVWTSGRLSSEAVDSASRALDRIEADAGASRLVLVGYSGGGALAVLLAAQRLKDGRTDVAGIVTVAGDIALRYWVARDHLAPLAGSLDPADAAPSLGNLPQVHFVGGKDETVEPDVAGAYLAKLPPGTPARLVTLPGYDHSCCWAGDWKSLAARPELAIIPGWL